MALMTEVEMKETTEDRKELPRRKEEREPRVEPWRVAKLRLGLVPRCGDAIEMYAHGIT